MAQYELSLGDYWRMLRKHFRLVGGCVSLMVGITVVYLHGQRAVYRAASQIKLEQTQTITTGMFQGMQSYYENPMITESRVIQSRSVAEEIARKMYPHDAERGGPEFQAKVGVIHGSIKAEPITETNIIQITVNGPTGEFVAQVANLAAEAYIDVNLSEKNRQARKVREFVESQLAQTEARLRAAEEAVRAMREQGTASGMAVVLENRITDLNAKLADLQPKLMDVHPDIIRLKAQIAQLEADLQQLPAAELDFARLNRDLQVNEKTYRSLRERLEEARIAEAEKVANASIIEWATAPGVPISPRRRIALAMGTLLGFLAGCVLAFIVETTDTSIGTIEDVETLLQVPVLGVIPHLGREEDLGEAPPPRRFFWDRWLQRSRFVREGRMPLHVHYHPNSIAAEAYRILRTNLKLSNERRTILVTSTGPAEGKTTMLSNLGIVTAQSGARTVLIAADLRRPELPRIFEMTKEIGLTEVLRGELEPDAAIRGLSDFVLGKFGYDEVLKNPYLANLFLISSGHLPENPVELIGSRRMVELLASLRARYDVVLVDGPPLLPVADSLLIAPHVDGVVLVYEVGRVSRAALVRAKAQLDSVGSKLLGVVLNHVRPEVQTQPKDYYYYRQRYAYTEKEAESAAPPSTG